jgi:2'-5' RNA ligase
MRTFVAIDIPFTTPIHQIYLDLQRNCNGLDIKYTDPKQGHLTLAFLGETNSKQINELHSDFLKLTLGFNKIQMELKGLGVFKSVRHPQVLWVGVNIPLQLKQLHEAIHNITQKQGFKRDHAAFAPHYTIGRVKQVSTNHNLSTFLEKYQNTVFGVAEMNEFVFYESILKPAGPVYKVLYKYTLV